MSSTRKIEGHAIDHGGWIEFDVSPDENGHWKPATLIIGGKALTEEEHEAEFQRRAKAMVVDMARAGHLGMGPEDTYVTFESIRTIAAKHGIQLP